MEDGGPQLGQGELLVGARGLSAALKLDASGLFLVSVRADGDAQPSRHERSFAQRLAADDVRIGLRLLDHIGIDPTDGDRYFSEHEESLHADQKLA